MGCSSSNVKSNCKGNFYKKNVEINLNGSLDDTIKNHLQKEKRKEVNVSHFKKVKEIYNMCEFQENVEFRDLYFFDSSYLTFFQKIGINKKLKVLYFKNVEFEGVFKFLIKIKKHIYSKFKKNFKLKKTHI